MARNVYIVDDDADAREVLTLLLSAAGFECLAFESGESFVAAWTPRSQGCVLLDVLMPGMGGLELLRWLQFRESVLSVVMLTGAGDVQLAVQAIKAGAVEFLEKPCDPATVIRVVEAAATESSARANVAAKAVRLRETYHRLSRREREVMTLVCRGLANKNIAPILGITGRTVEAHRAQVMSKMGAGSLAELVKMQMFLDQPDAASSTTPLLT